MKNNSVILLNLRRPTSEFTDYLLISSRKYQVIGIYNTYEQLQSSSMMFQTSGIKVKLLFIHLDDDVDQCLSFINKVKALNVVEQIIIFYDENTNKMHHKNSCISFLNRNISKEEIEFHIQRLFVKDHALKHSKKVSTNTKTEDRKTLIEIKNVSNLETRPLTFKENMVVGFIALGLNSKSIAERMSVSIRTVSTHRRNILRKFNCKNMAQVLHMLKNNQSISYELIKS